MGIFCIIATRQKLDFPNPEWRWPAGVPMIATWLPPSVILLWKFGILLPVNLFKYFRLDTYKFRLFRYKHPTKTHALKQLILLICVWCIHGENCFGIDTECSVSLGLGTWRWGFCSGIQSIRYSYPPQCRSWWQYYYMGYVGWNKDQNFLQHGNVTLCFLFVIKSSCSFFFFF